MLEPKHWAVIAGLITGVATQLLTAQHGWADIVTPGFFAGLLIQIASAITALFVGAPGAAAELDHANRRADVATERATEAEAKPTVTIISRPGPGTAALLLVLLLLPASAGAQVGTEPLAWQPQNRPLADGISTALVGIQAGATVVHDVKTWRDGDRKPTFRSGCSIAVALATTESLKRIFPETRPDGSDNLSGFSGHSASTAALSGWNFTFGIPISVATGFFRADANKHHMWGPGQSKDIPIGWAIGAGAQLLCSALIR